MIAELLIELTGAAGVYLRTERGIGRLEGVELHDGPLGGEPPPGPIDIEEPMAFDSSSIWPRAKRPDSTSTSAKIAGPLPGYAAGRRMLDAFCYTGGFGLHAARAGARTSRPSTRPPRLWSWPAQNAGTQRPGPDSLRSRRRVRSPGEHWPSEVERFGMIVLDPPKFARSRSAIPEALARLSPAADRWPCGLLEPDGILVTCCCTGLITMDMLDELLAQVAAEARRDVQILERRGQAADHPVAVSCLESNYLKCLIARAA